MKVLFMGTPAFALPTLLALKEAGHEVQAVFTQPPRPSGRGLVLHHPPVAQRAEALGLPVFWPNTLKDADVLERVRALAPDLAVVVAYGLLLPPLFLEIPRWGCFNLHASLLPRWRGAAPMARAIMARDSHVGFSIMRLSEGLDSGPVCLEEKWPLSPETTLGELHDETARRGALSMLQALASLENGTLSFREQPQEGVTYASKITKQACQIFFDQDPEDVVAHIHGLSPFPGAWTTLSGSRLKILKARAMSWPDRHVSRSPGTVTEDGRIACKNGAILPLLVQKEGKVPLEMSAFLRGARDLIGQRCGA